jgi:beta-1,4-mannosyltransferase
MSAFQWGLAVFGLTYLIVPLILFKLQPPEPTAEDLQRRKRAIVLVLGDLGRSPRMNYHALSLANGGLDVELCGYTETPLMEAISEHPRISIHSLPVIENNPPRPFVLYAVRKVIVQHLYLYRLLKKFVNADFLIVQNPPSIPVLGVVRYFCLFVSKRTKLVIDWHNLGYSILSLKLGPDHPFVYIHRLYEKWLGRIAFVHLTVTIAMGHMLRENFNMKAKRIIPFYDRPSSLMNVLSDSEKQQVITNHPELFSGYDKQKCKIVITSTSYTPDENLYTLLEALKTYASTSPSSSPDLRVIVTGKGPMYEEMKQEIANISSQLKSKVTIHQAWLSAEEYPKIIGVADLGVSLHESSSGWDLPMKVVDMFGCGIPVVALGFAALPELVKENENGVIVKDSASLAAALKSIFSSNRKIYEQIKAGAVREARIKWNDNWNKVLGPLFSIGEYAPVPDDYESDSSTDSD